MTRAGVASVAMIAAGISAAALGGAAYWAYNEPAVPPVAMSAPPVASARAPNPAPPAQNTAGNEPAPPAAALEPPPPPTQAVVTLGAPSVPSPAIVPPVETIAPARPVPVKPAMADAGKDPMRGARAASAIKVMAPVPAVDRPDPSKPPAIAAPATPLPSKSPANRLVEAVAPVRPAPMKPAPATAAREPLSEARVAPVADTLPTRSRTIAKPPAVSVDVRDGLQSLPAAGSKLAAREVPSSVEPAAHSISPAPAPAAVAPEAKAGALVGFGTPPSVAAAAAGSAPGPAPASKPTPPQAERPAVTAAVEPATSPEVSAVAKPSVLSVASPTPALNAPKDQQHAPSIAIPRTSAKPAGPAARHWRTPPSDRTERRAIAALPPVERSRSAPPPLEPPEITIIRGAHQPTFGAPRTPERQFASLPSVAARTTTDVPPIVVLRGRGSPRYALATSGQAASSRQPVVVLISGAGTRRSVIVRPYVPPRARILHVR